MMEVTKEQIAKGVAKFIQEDMIPHISDSGMQLILGVTAGAAETSPNILVKLLSNEMLDSFIQPVGVELENYIAENGRDFVQKEVNEKIMVFEQKSILDLCREMNLQEEKIRDTVRSIYRSASADAVNGVLKNVDISAMIEDKINDMKTEELEKVVLTVMKKELDTIVNLGALIGLILGSLNTIL